MPVLITAWLTGAICTASLAVLATDVTWTNTTPGGAAWETPGNWNAGVPGPSHRAVLANGGTAVVNSTFSITNMLLRSHSRLRVESGVMKITDPAANAIKFADTGGTGYVEQVDGILEITAAQAMYWGYGAGGIGVSLAVVTTGEPAYREAPLPGAALTRVMSSHLRIGTFQYAAAFGTGEALRALAVHSSQQGNETGCASP